MSEVFPEGAKVRIGQQYTQLIVGDGIYTILSRVPEGDEGMFGPQYCVRNPLGEEVIVRATLLEWAETRAEWAKRMEELHGDFEAAAKKIGTTDGSTYSVVDGESYSGGEDTVVLNHRDEDGCETSESLTRANALELAIELATVAGAGTMMLRQMKNEMAGIVRRTWEKRLLGGMSGQELEDLDDVANRLFGRVMDDRHVSEEAAELAVATFRREQAEE